MSYLLDTQALIFFFENDPRLSPKAKALIEDPQNRIYVSIASLWEIAIKISIGKLHPTQPLKKFFERIPQEAMDLMTWVKTISLPFPPFRCIIVTPSTG